MRAAVTLTEKEWEAVESFAASPRLRLQGLLLAKMRLYYDAQPDAPRLKRCECVMHDVAVWLANKRKKEKV